MKVKGFSALNTGLNQFDMTAKPAVKAKPKKELKPLNTKIFVLDGDDILKSSHIYEVKNGKIRAFIEVTRQMELYTI